MRHIFFYSVLSIVCHSASAQNGTVKDIDGNVYKTVKIGTQVWMAENLKTAHYRDGSPIVEIEDSTQWTYANHSQRAAWCYYNSNAVLNPSYGKLYNWYAVVDPHHLCPAGWHEPSDSEWTVLTDYLGGDEVAGGKMKAATLWNDPYKGLGNSSGFSALPGGHRAIDGTFILLGTSADFWSSTGDFNDFGWFRSLCCNSSDLVRNAVYRNVAKGGLGYSVRCVGD